METLLKTYDAPMTNLLDEFFGMTPARAPRRTAWTVPVDVAETEAGYEISVHAPGMTKKDFDIEVKNNHLVITGERKREDAKEGKTYKMVESTYGRFTRSFELTDAIDRGDISATYRNGVLTVSLSKTEEYNIRKKIEVK